MDVHVISKATGAVTRVSGEAVSLDAPSVVRLDLARSEVAGFEREGNALIVRLTNGDHVEVANFHPEDAGVAPHDLVLNEPGGTMWQARVAPGAPRFVPLEDPEDLVAAAGGGGGASLALPAALLGGVVAAGGAAAALGGGGGSDTPATQPDPATQPVTTPPVTTPPVITPPDTTPPAAPSVTIAGDGTSVTGLGEAGATVTVRDAAGAVIASVIVAADGSFTTPLSPAQSNGGSLAVTQTDAAGNVSPAVQVAAPDTTAPAAPEAAIDAGGATITGRGEAGATVTVRDAAGIVIASVVVAADGSFTTPLSPAQSNGGSLAVTQTDAAGNISPAVQVAAPDTTAPGAPEAVIDAGGATVTGRGEASATVTVRDAAGIVIASVVVAADGSFATPLSPAQANGGSLAVTQTDAAGNVSPAVQVAAPDTTAPGAPEAAIDAGGATVTGRGEAGATVTVRDAAGIVIASVVVAADGSFTTPLSPAQASGGSLAVTQTDAAGNVSAAVQIASPDLTAPVTPAAAVSGDGTLLSGTGEAGATVTVTDANGVVIGTATAGTDGGFAVPLSPAQTNGETLGVSQADAAGNASPVVGVVAPDITAPAAPTIALDGTGTIATGTGEPGATITITGEDGVVLGSGNVDAGGRYEITLRSAQTDGERVEAVQSDAAGNASGTASTIAPDFTAPAQPVAAINGDGTLVTGTGEPGAQIVVRDLAGTTIGIAQVGVDGQYSVLLDPAQANGERLNVIQTDAAGNAASPLSLIAPDVTAPAAPAAALDATGTIVSGTGEPGARISVRDATDTEIGAAIVDARGNYDVVLVPPQIDSQLISVVQADAAGNVSTATALIAPDQTAPAAPTGTVAADGASLTGTGEAGATLTVRSPVGAVIGTIIVAGDGSYTVTLTPSQIDGETLSVRQVDAAGNASPEATAVAPDLVADLGPDAPTATITIDGSAVTGSAVAGATVTLFDADGVVIATGLAAGDGQYSIALVPALRDGETIRVTQTDGDGNVSPPATAIAPDLTAPDAPSAVLDQTGTALTGTGDAGAAITVRDADGTVIGTATANAAGAFAVILDPAQRDGGTLAVTQADAAGNVSAPALIAVPDVTAPAAPTATVEGDGSLLVGTGEAGTIVTVRDPSGTAIGTATVAADGGFRIVLDPVQADGETLSVTLTDGAGNVSAPATAIAPDITAPGVPTATISGDGSVVTGSGQVGATVTVTAPGGATLGTAIVAADGAYAVALVPPQLDGEALSVVQADRAGNVSAPVGLLAPDTTAPDAPAATISGDGSLATGTGAPGATISVTNAAGIVIGTAIVAEDRSYAATLTPAQANGERLGVTQADAAGNVSASTGVTAPDITAPPAPVAMLDASGSVVMGTGEPGATLTVRDAFGTPLGTAIVTAQGEYSVTLATPQIDRQTLSVSQADAAGNPSPATTLTAPDLTAPAAPLATVAPDGLTLTGTGEAGATVTVRDPLGRVLGQAVVQGDGTYTVPLDPAQTNGEVLGVDQRDVAGNGSPIVTATAPDLVADTTPDAPSAAVDPDGAAVAGTANASAAVIVYDAVGTIIGTGVAGPDGSYRVALVPARIDGETVRVTQTDADGDVSPPATAVAPDLTAPAAPTAMLDLTGGVVTGTGEPGATITIRAADTTSLGTAIVGANGAYAVTLTPAQTDGQTLAATQADAAGNVSAPIALVAPDYTAPALPVVTIAPDGSTATGIGEPGATVTIRLGAVILGTAQVAADGSYTAQLSPAPVNGETLLASQADPTGNVSAIATVAAPDITAPPPPIISAITNDGTTLTGTGEVGARVEVRDPDATLIGVATVDADGRYTVTLAPAQAAGGTLSVTQADATGNVSVPASIAAPFDIAAFGNVDAAGLDLLPTTAPVDLGSARYLALVSLGLVDLDAEVLAVRNVRFSVAEGHSLDARFTYDAAVSIGVASDYAVVVQKLVGTQWVAVTGNGPASLLEIGLLNGNLSATETLGPGVYRAFLTFQGTAGLGLLGDLSVAGIDSDFTDIAGATPIAATGNVITDAGPGGEIDVTGPGTRVASVTVNGVTTDVGPDGSSVTGAWGSLRINPDGSYSYTPVANAGAIGRTETFTYTLVDPTDGERETATLTIAIGSPDITGAPLAVADQAFADVTFQNVVTTLPPAQAFDFTSTGAILTGQATGTGTGSFTVAPAAVSDITIVAARTGGLLSVLPAYTVSVRNAEGVVVRTSTINTALNLGLGGVATFTFDDLPSGSYSYQVSSNAALSVGSFGTTVSLGSSTLFLNDYTLATRETATGNLLDNDTTNTSFAAIRVDRGSGFAEIGDTPVTLTGRYGTLQIDETGGYAYQPSATLGFSAVDLTDSFTYQLVQPNGVLSTATLTVTIDVPGDGPAAAAGFASVASDANGFAELTALVETGDLDVIPLDALTVQSVESGAFAAAGPVIGLATYDLFEGQGELEDVLSQYLAEEPQASIREEPDTVSFDPIVVTEIATVVDPFDYLATIPDQDQNGLVTSHVV
ncbi:hypothetical protein C8J24_3168 [Sphingomonas aerolata]|uniref:BapA prefix-like domain-containing protein n=1 Tax=Sphingomonas aerolata TaxID=185951 RepID=A0A2T4YNI1_9SPHN|nr:BapA/Bap/LapF family large adhesin [Sphingomonas aerolata]PTM44951.1 hypothetical protein C8J24_3168 [Sphingomonas aerolata]